MKRGLGWCSRDYDRVQLLPTNNKRHALKVLNVEYVKARRKKRKLVLVKDHLLSWKTLFKQDNLFTNRVCVL